MEFYFHHFFSKLEIFFEEFEMRFPPPSKKTSKIGYIKSIKYIL